MVTPDQTTELAEVFRLLGEPNRLGIVLGCLDAPVRVGDLAARLDISPSLVSHHLRLLRAARLLKGERRGKEVYYGLDDGHVKDMLHSLIEHMVEPHDRDNV